MDIFIFIKFTFLKPSKAIESHHIALWVSAFMMRLTLTKPYTKETKKIIVNNAMILCQYGSAILYFLPTRGRVTVCWNRADKTRL